MHNSITLPASWEKTAAPSPTDLLESGLTTRSNPAAGKLYTDRKEQLHYNGCPVVIIFKLSEINQCAKINVSQGNIPKSQNYHYKYSDQSGNKPSSLKWNENNSSNLLLCIWYIYQNNLPAGFILLSESFSFAAQSYRGITTRISACYNSILQVRVVLRVYNLIGLISD